MSGGGGTTVQVPILVAHRPATGYRLSCVFLPQLYASAPRYERALSRLRQAITQHFREVRTSRHRLDDLLWLSFAPSLRFERVPLGFDAGQRWIEGLFATVFFDVGARHCACLPMLDGLVADLGPLGLGQAGRHERLVAHLQADFRARRKAQGDAFEPARHVSLPTDELGEIEVSLRLQPSPFPFEAGGAWRARLHGEPLDGARELRVVAADLNERHPEDLSPAVERDALVDALHQSLYRTEPAAVVLVGPRGVGKTALVHGAVARYLGAEAGRDPAKLTKLWHLDPLRVVSGMSEVGQWQRRMEAVLQHLHARGDLLYCDNLVALLSVGKSAQNSLTLADVLRPHLESRALTLVGEATPEAWQKLQQRDRRFADLFRVVRVEPPPRATALRIVTWRRAELEQRHECRIAPEALAELLKMEGRFAGDEVLPGSVLRVLERLATRHARKDIGRAEVLAAFTATHHFREAVFSRHLGLDLRQTAAEAGRRLMGQPQVRSALVDVVALVKSGLAAPGKPLTSMLFIGPTGVGKSEAAKVLADLLFADAGGLVRFDMNEYVDADAVDRLIGDARRPDGQLTAAVRQRRAAVLLLDEIEKAHPAVHDLLLQVLGEGRLTDALGRTTDFSQCVVVLTSNLGAAAAGRNTGFVAASTDATPTYREAVERFFRPEFLNRLDQIVPFVSLGPTDMAAIAALQLDRVLTRDGFVRRMTFLNLDPQAMAHLAALGHDEALGARALKRGIERVLTAPIARRLAASPAGQPMLLEVRLGPQGLHSEATLLTQAAARPVPPPPQTDRPADYRGLQAWAESLQAALHDALDQAPPASPDTLALRALQVRLDPLREVLARRCWDLDQRRGPRHGVSGARANRRVSARLRNWGASRQHLLADLSVQQDLSDFLEQVQASAEPLRTVECETAGWCLQLSLLQRRLSAWQARGLDRVALDIAPLQDQRLSPCVATAWADVEVLLDELDAHELPSPRAGVRSFEGAGLLDLLAGEQGLHLWSVGEEARPLPLGVRLQPLAQAGTPAPLPTEMVRLRRAATPGGAGCNLTDLRSGWVRQWSQGALTSSDWGLLLWQGDLTALDAAVRACS
ncbi:MAG: AAA family ATPase [Pseudomonadota bacterium]